MQPEAIVALRQRLTRMNPRAPQRLVHFGDVALAEVFDLRGFNLTSHLDIDPAFLAEADGRAHDHVEGDGHDECLARGAHTDHPMHGDDVKSFVFRSTLAFDPAQLERFLGRLVDEHGPSMLRYKGILHMDGSRRKVIFQGVHQLMNSDQGPRWGADELRQTRIVFIGIDMPEDHIRRGLAACLR